MENYVKFYNHYWNHYKYSLNRCIKIDFTSAYLGSF